MRWQKILGTIRHPIIGIHVSTAKRRHRKVHPEDLITGFTQDPRSGRKCEVHHNISVHVRPDLACDPTNLRTLLPVFHLWLGHPGGWKTWNTNLDLTIQVLREAYRQTALVWRKNKDGTYKSWKLKKDA